jgi:hypothetical protein
MRGLFVAVALAALARPVLATCPTYDTTLTWDLVPIEACDPACENTGGGTMGAPSIYVGNVTANAWVFYWGPSCIGPTQWGPVTSLPAGAWLLMVDSTGANYAYVPASSVTFGAGVAYTPPFDISQLDSPTLLYSYAAGFTLVGMAWGLGQAVGAIMRVVRR